MYVETISLVVGADGIIGRELVRQLRCADKPVIETTRRRDTLSEHRVLLDLEEASDWNPPCRVSVAYFGAGVGELERCRREPVASARVNVHNTVALAKTLVAEGTFVIFLSTNLVYDGSIPFRKAIDPVCPQTEYGRQKAEAERQLLALGDLVSVVRSTKVIGHDMPLFAGWIQALRNNQVIHPFSDMVLAPLTPHFMADVLQRVADARLPSILQVSGERDVTYAQVAQHIAQRLGVPQDLVQPTRSGEANLSLEAVPAHTTLDTTRLRTQWGLEPPGVWSTIDSMLSL